MSKTRLKPSKEWTVRDIFIELRSTSNTRKFLSILLTEWVNLKPELSDLEVDTFESYYIKRENYDSIAIRQERSNYAVLKMNERTIQKLTDIITKNIRFNNRG